MASAAAHDAADAAAEQLFTHDEAESRDSVVGREFAVSRLQNLQGIPGAFLMWHILLSTVGALGVLI